QGMRIYRAQKANEANSVDLVNPCKILRDFSSIAVGKIDLRDTAQKYCLLTLDQDMFADFTFAISIFAMIVPAYLASMGTVCFDELSADTRYHPYFQSTG